MRSLCDKEIDRDGQLVRREEARASKAGVRRLRCWRSRGTVDCERELSVLAMEVVERRRGRSRGLRVLIVEAGASVCSWSVCGRCLRGAFTAQKISFTSSRSYAKPEIILACGNYQWEGGTVSLVTTVGETWWGEQMQQQMKIRKNGLIGVTIGIIPR
jgi:hypothetical protein